MLLCSEKRNRKNEELRRSLIYPGKKVKERLEEQYKIILKHIKNYIFD